MIALKEKLKGYFAFPFLFSDRSICATVMLSQHPLIGVIPKTSNRIDLIVDAHTFSGGQPVKILCFVLRSSFAYLWFIIKSQLAVHNFSLNTRHS